MGPRASTAGCGKQVDRISNSSSRPLIACMRQGRSTRACVTPVCDLLLTRGGRVPQRNGQEMDGNPSSIHRPFAR